jgi:GTPase
MLENRKHYIYFLSFAIWWPGELTFISSLSCSSRLSSLIGTLITGQLDDGRGLSRSKIMIHKHEMESGRTSTISSHLLGYDMDSKPIFTHSNNGTKKEGIKTDADVAAKAASLVSLMDLAGHEKYLKTTIHGISSGMIEYSLVLVNANHPPTHMTRHHINISVACGIPIIIVLTKVDRCPAHVLKSTKDEISAIIRSPEVNKKIYQVKKDFDISIVQNKLHAITPIISISCVTGQGIDLVHMLLSSLPKRRRHHQKINRSFEFLVDKVFNVTGVGTVVSGFVNAGHLVLGQKAFLGPYANGKFIQSQIKSMHIASAHVNSIIAGNTACLGLTLSKDEKRLVRKGMTVFEHPVETSVAFEAEMTILRGKGVDGTTIRPDYETMVHVLHIKQHARIETIEVIGDAYGGLGMDLDADDNIIRPGSRAKIKFRFLQQKVK